MTCFMVKFLSCSLLDFVEVLYFFLVGYARDYVARCATACIEARLRSLLRTYERSTCSKSSILFTETKSRPMRKERRQNPAILTEKAWLIKDLFYEQIIVVLIHNGLSCCYLVFYGQAGYEDTDLYHFLAYPSQHPLREGLAHATGVHERNSVP